MKAAKNDTRVSSLNLSLNSIIYSLVFDKCSSLQNILISNFVHFGSVEFTSVVISTANLPEIKYIYRDMTAKVTSGEGSPFKNSSLQPDDETS